MSDAERTLFVGGLTDKTTEELLYELFLQAGPLEKVTIPKEKDGRKKRFAFVTFRHEDSVPYSVKVMEGIQMHGQTLRIQPRTGSSHSSPYSSPQYDSQSMPTPPYQRSHSWQESPVRPIDGAPFRSPQYQTNYRQGQSEYRDRSHDRERSHSRDRSDMGSNWSDSRSRHDRSDHDNKPNDNRPNLHKSKTWHPNDLSSAGAERGRSGSQEMDRSSNMSPLVQDSDQIMLSGSYPGGPQFQPDRDPISFELRRQRVLSQQGHSLGAHRQHNYDRHDRNMQPWGQRRRY